jgi:hypothetical protein
MDENLNYQQDLVLDITKLDKHWLEQPMMFMRYAEAAALARSERDNAKEALEVTRAKVARKIRDNPEKFGMAKVTEASVNEAILLDPEVLKAGSAFNEARYNTDLLGAAVEAMDQRRRALEGLVQLHGQQYFAAPRMPQSAEAVSESATDKMKGAKTPRVRE